MQRYSGLSIFLHWLMAALISLTLGLGLYMVDLRVSPSKLKFYSWHKWLGVTLFALTTLRILVRMIAGTPAYPSAAKAWEKRLAHSMHLALYVLLFAIPISGYFYTYAAGFPVVYFGLIELPALIEPNSSHKLLFKALHVALTTALLLLMCLHIAAALTHHFINKDGILQRMLPFKSDKST